MTEVQISTLNSRKKRGKKVKKEKPYYEKFGLREFLFLAPAYISLILFVFIPMLFAIVLSFYKNPNETEFNFTYFITEMWNNLSFSSLYDFFFVEEYQLGLLTKRGVFLVPGMIVLVTTIIMIAYSRLVYRKFTEKGRIKNNILRGVIAFLIGLVTAPLTYYIFRFVTIWFNGIMISNGWENGFNYLPIEVYRRIIAAPDIAFMRILFNTFFWTLTCTFIHVVFGLILAVVLNREFKGRGIARSLMILPWAIPSFVSTLMWRYYVFDSDLGVLGAPSVSSYSVTTANILVLIASLAIVGFIVWGIFKLFKIEKLNSIIRPSVTFVLVGIGILGFFLLNKFLQQLIQGMGGGGFFGYKVIDFQNITSTFWITDIVNIFGSEFAMITFSAILINSWLGIPFMMLSFLATLQSIPKDLYEAAEIDGLSRWDKFKKITLPLLKPTLLTVSLLGIIWTFNLFNVVYLLSNNQNGLPEGEVYDIFVTFIYNRFHDRNEYSQSAALSITVFIMLISFSLVYRRLIQAEKLWEGEKK